MADNNQSTKNNSGAEEQGHHRPEDQMGGITEGQTSERETTEERSNEQNQPISINVTDMSSQRTNNTGASTANEGTASDTTVSNETSPSSSADEELRRGRQRERPPQFTVERVPYGGIVNKRLHRAIGRDRQKSRSKDRSRVRPSNESDAMKSAKQGSFNIISLPTNAQPTGAPSETPHELKREDKGKQRAIEANPSTENLPTRRESLGSPDLQSSQRSNPFSFFSSLFGNPSPANGPSNAGPSNAGPSNAGPSSAGPSNAGPSDAAPSRPPRNATLAKRHSNSSSTHRTDPSIYLQEARKLLLLSMANPEQLRRSRVNLKNYPFSKEAAEVYCEVQMYKRLLEQTRALLKDAVENNDVFARENNTLSKAWEQDMVQLQMALENEIEEKERILKEAEKRRENVSNASTQTAISKANHQTETGVVAGILAKYKDRLAATQPGTCGRRSIGAGRQVDWSRLAPRSWETQSSRMRRFLHAHAENSDDTGGGASPNNIGGGDDNGNQRDNSDRDAPGAPGLPLFTFEMHEQHESTCEEEEKRIKTRKEGKEPK